MMEDYQELSRVEPETIPAIADDVLLATADQVEKRIAAIQRIKQAALRVTRSTDWIDQNGKPYLQVSGAEKIARLFGISWRIDEPVLEKEDDGHFSYTYKGYFSMGPSEIEAIGVRSSSDPFFSRAHKEDIPPSEIDKGNVKKAAYTNCIGNGITRLLGLRNLSNEDVQGAGIDTTKSAKVEYQKPEMSKDAQEMRAQILKMLEEIAEGDPMKVLDYLEMATEFVGKDGKEVRGKRDLSKVSEKQLPVTYGKVKESYETWLEEHQQPELGDGNA
jgi:hypothetical protein